MLRVQRKPEGPSHTVSSWGAAEPQRERSEGGESGHIHTLHLTHRSNSAKVTELDQKGFPMPSVNPRINLTLPPHRYELLTRLAKLQGSSRAGIITETMELIYPMLERVCVVLEAAERAQQTRREGLLEVVAKAEAELMPLLYDAVSQFDLFMDDVGGTVGLEKSAERSMEQVRQIMQAEGPRSSGSSGRREPDGRAASGVNPRICNTGVRSTKSAKNPKSARGSK